MSDSVYWDSTGIVVGTTKTLNNAMYEMQTGTGSISLAANGHAATTAITFSKAFSAMPLVVVSNATDSADAGMAGVQVVVCHNPKPSTTGFTAAVFSDKKTTTAKTVKFNYVALVPKKAWVTKGDGGTWSGDTIQLSRGLTTKGQCFGSATFSNVSTGTSLTCWTEGNVGWSIQGAVNNKVPLPDCYYSMRYGSSSITCANNSTATLDVSIPNDIVYKTAPIVICCINSALTAAWHDVKVSAYSPTDIDNHKQFRLRVWNYSGASRDVGINWIVFGKVD